MLNCFAEKPATTPIPITIIAANEYAQWLTKQNEVSKNWLQSAQFRGEAGTMASLPDNTGKISRIICCVTDLKNFWGVGSLPITLPENIYEFDMEPRDYDKYAIAWGLGAYQFTRYKKPSKKPAQLSLQKSQQPADIANTVEAIYLVRDLINTPTDDMGPTALAQVVVELAKEFNATVKQIIGDDLLKENYASIHTVGRASDEAPRLIDLRWGNPAHPRVTLVGKGVCFDTGGLDIKNAAGMILMKKDMAGAAHVLGLARMIMTKALPINLRVLIPAVENSVSGNAYRPGDIIKSRKGITVEIGNTDAEGRVVLADALTEAVSEKPELIIDIATLTGAARVALGTELPALFSNSDSVATDLIAHGDQQLDPMWRLPLYTLYRDSLNSPIADINNSSTDGYAGAIVAGLFLKEFVPDDIPWVHFDLMAWNLKSRPGKPVGGEAMAIRALFAYLVKKYQAA
jgi:leucyl aminopeptidase